MQESLSAGATSHDVSPLSVDAAAPPLEPAVGPLGGAATAAAALTAPASGHPPAGRVTAVDWFKGFAICSMCTLHYATTVLGAMNLDIHSTAISPAPLLDGFLQLHNGAFFLLSAFGNWFSIRRGMDRAEAKNPANPDYGPVTKTILVRGALIMGLGMFATFFFNHGIFDTLILVGSGSGVQGPWWDAFTHSLRSGWANGLLSPMVTPYIGFSVMVGGLIAFRIEKMCGPETSRRKTKMMALAFVSVFIGGICIRRFLDLATSGVGGSACHSWNQTELDAAGITMPSRCWTTHTPTLDFSDTAWPGKKPTAQGPHNISCPKVTNISQECPYGQMGSDGVWKDFSQADSYLHAIKFGCLRGYPKSVSDTSFAHLTDLDRGYQCCSTANREDASIPTSEELHNPRMECCQLTPAYAPPHGSGGAMGAGLWQRTTFLQKVGQLLTWPLVGTYGFFCYGAESIAGYLIAMHVRRDGWTKELFQAIFTAFFVSQVIAGFADWWLFFQDGNESIQQASPINRAYIIGTELMAFGVICGVIEGRRTSGFFACCSPCKCCAEKGCCSLTADEKWRGFGGAEHFKQTPVYRFFKRFAMISFTIYHTEGNVRNIVSFCLGAVGGHSPPFCVGAYPEDSDCYQAAHECDSPHDSQTCQLCKDGKQLRDGYDQGVTTNVITGILYVGCVITFWGVGLWQWEKHGFVGSFEWGMQKVLSATRKAKSDVLSAKTHTEKPFVAGIKSNTDAVENGWVDIPFGEMCPCPCCARCANDTEDLKTGSMDSHFELNKM